MSVSPCAEIYWFVVRLSGGERYATVRMFGPSVTSRIHCKLRETSNFFKTIFEKSKQTLNTQNSHSLCNETYKYKLTISTHVPSGILIHSYLLQGSECFKEANWFEASQEIPLISRNPNVHFCTQKRPPHVSILGQPNSVHIPTSHLLQIHPNIIHPSTPRSPQWSLSLWFPH